MTRYRWFIVGVSFFAIIINYLDRSALSYAITPLKETYGFTNIDFGIIAAAFGVGYLIMTVVGGILVDHYGARKVWSCSSIFWSVACALLALSTGFWWFFIFRLLLGVAEGPNFPALTRVDTDWLPISERVRALAIGLAAVPFASVLGAPLITQLVATVGWRWMFAILGFIGIIWAVIWYIIYRDDPRQCPQVSEKELRHILHDFDSNTHTEHSLENQKTSWRFMLFHRELLVNNYAFFAFGYLLFFAITWLPGYLQQMYGVNVKQVGWFLVAPWLLATLLLLLGGVLSDYLWNKTRNLRIARSHIIWVCQVISAICFIPVIFHPSLSVALICISLGMGFGIMPNAAFYAINADLARDKAATSLGIMDCAFALAGILAPLFTGILSTWTGNFAAAFLLLILLTFSSALAIILFQKMDGTRR